MKVSAAAGGGMVLGFSWLAACSPALRMSSLFPIIGLISMLFSK